MSGEMKLRKLKILIFFFLKGIAMEFGVYILGPRMTYRDLLCACPADSFCCTTCKTLTHSVKFFNFKMMHVVTVGRDIAKLIHIN